MSQPLAPRNAAFASAREPLRRNASLQLDNSRISGPFKFLNPTRAHYKHVQAASVEHEDDDRDDDQAAKTAAQPAGKQVPASQVDYRWTSRNNRKGRHQLVAVEADDKSDAKYLVPEKTNSPKAILQTIWKMFTFYPYYDISWLVAYIFTWGSIVWVICT